MTTCPDDQTLAGLVDGQLDESSRSRMLVHVDACPVCFDRVATMAAAAETSVFVPPGLVRAVTTPSKGHSAWRTWLPAGAVAAGALLAVAVWRPFSPVMPPADPAVVEPSIRSRGTSVVTPVVQAPGEDEPLEGGFQVRWQSPEAAVFSEVKLTTAGGDVLWSAEVQGATSHVDVPVAPPAGGVAYLWVTTHHPEGRKVSSNGVRVRGTPGR